MIETAVVLEESKGADLQFKLDRGRVVIVNARKAGEAYARLTIRDRTVEVLLKEPGTRVAVEVYGRWLPGTPFVKDPKPGYGPSLDLAVLVLKGSVEFKGEDRTVAMSEPPGPALLQWDSDTGGDLTPRFVKEAPDWAEAGKTEEGKARQAALAVFRKEMIDKGLDKTLDEYLDSDNPRKRRLAVLALGALDKLPRLAQALMKTKYPDVWEAAVLALRHWIGRGPGQDQKLYQGLVKNREYTEVDAGTVLQMLHDFGEEELARPETWETLIDYLDHPKVGVRGLAHWHLARHVPAGKKIGYLPMEPEADRKKDAAEWRKLIPPGTVPPRRPAEDKKP
jgi:hypothetical protein